MKKKSSTTQQFDEKFDQGENILEDLNLENAVRRVNVDLPSWVIQALDQESNRVGVSRQALIKFWLTEKLDQISPHAY